MDDFDDSAPEETRDTPAASSYEPPVDTDEEPAETKATPPRGALAAAQQAPPEDQTAADAAMAALESDALYQQLPDGYKRKVLAGMPVAAAYAERNRQLMASGQRKLAATIAAEQAKTADALQRLEQMHQQRYAEQERRAEERIEKLRRFMTGEPEPEVKPAAALTPQDQLLLGVAERLDGLTAFQQQQAEEALVQREIAMVEQYSAADVERAVQAVPWYPDAEAYVEQLAFTEELAAINNAYPELSDAEASRYAAQRVMQMASNLMVEARLKGISLAAEVIGMAQKYGFQPQGQGAGQAAPAAPRPGSSAARLAEQQRREAGVVGATGGGRGTGGQNLTQMSRDVAAAALTMSDEDFDAFLGEGKDGDKRFRSILSQRAE